MNYIITGGTGFIGTHLTNLLKERYPNAQVYNLDIVKPGTPNPVVKDYKPALREGREGADGLRRGRPRLHGGGDPDAGQHGMVFPAAVLPVRVDHVPDDLLAVAAPRRRAYQAGFVVSGDVDRGRRYRAGADGLHRR